MRDLIMSGEEFSLIFQTKIVKHERHINAHAQKRDEKIKNLFGKSPNEPLSSLSSNLVGGGRAQIFIDILCDGSVLFGLVLDLIF